MSSLTQDIIFNLQLSAMIKTRTFEVLTKISTIFQYDGKLKHL